MKLQKISLSELLAVNVPYDAAEVVASFGIQPSRNPQGLIAQLDKLTVRYREQFLQKLGEIHPHRDLILASVEAEKPAVEKVASVKIEDVKPVLKTVEETIKANDTNLKLAVVGMAGLIIGMMIYHNRG